MIIGVPKEIKNSENRVGMTPSGVAELMKHGHAVHIQRTAGKSSGFSDETYIATGAQILPTMGETYTAAQIIVKVEEPIAPEYKLICKGQLLFTYFHFAFNKELTLVMIENGSICLAYETVEKADHSLPLLISMSEVAGHMTIQRDARFLERPQGGKGILLGGVPGTKPARVLILDGGIVGSNAAQMAAGLRASVTVANVSLAHLRHLSEVLPKDAKTLYASELRLKKRLPDADLVIGSVLIPGDEAPHLITRSMLKMLQPGVVLVNIAIGRGGCFETSHPITHSEPTCVVDGTIHYIVANIPGTVPYTSTLALTNATLPYVTALAGKGWKQACKEDLTLALGLNVVEGKVVYKAIAEVFGLKYEQLNLE